jgi:hypothetical protein
MKVAGITAVAGRDAMRERQRRGRIEAPSP